MSINIFVSQNFTVETFVIKDADGRDGLLYFHEDKFYNNIAISFRAKFNYEFYEDLNQDDYNKFLNWLKFSEREFILDKILEKN